jgi:hypothetical protein
MVSSSTDFGQKNERLPKIVTEQSACKPPEIISVDVADADDGDATRSIHPSNTKGPVPFADAIATTPNISVRSINSDRATVLGLDSNDDDDDDESAVAPPVLVLASPPRVMDCDASSISVVIQCSIIINVSN